MRKIIRIGIVILFITVVIITLFTMYKLVISEPNTSDDILGSSLEFLIAAALFTPVIVVELDLFYIALYFTSDKKTPKKTGFNIAIVPVLLFIGLGIMLFYQSVKTAELILFCSFGIYLVLRTVYVVLLYANKLSK